jgi:hypothetical protein
MWKRELQSSQICTTYRACGNELLAKGENSRNPFLVWLSALAFDRIGEFEYSQKIFDRSSQLFVDYARECEKVATALYEYSALMIGFSLAQQARKLMATEDLDESLAEFGKACDIFRASVHFAFLAPYVSACASFEQASRQGLSTEESLQGFRNAIALIEQSKIALSFRDDRSPLIKELDKLLDGFISKALSVEKGEAQLQQESTHLEYQHETNRAQSSLQNLSLNYFPVSDPQRALSGPLLISYLTSDVMRLLNIGSEKALLVEMNKKKLFEEIEINDSFAYPASQLERGRLRVVYRDPLSGSIFDEGCGILV